MYHSTPILRFKLQYMQQLDKYGDVLGSGHFQTIQTLRQFEAS